MILKVLLKYHGGDLNSFLAEENSSRGLLAGDKPR